MARVREAVFSIWGRDLVDSAFLDLYCGSGGVGLEALSRGAGRLLGIDRDASALRLAEENARVLGCEGRARWMRGDLPAALRDPKRLPRSPFRFVFADAPYAGFDGADLVQALGAWVVDGARLAIEHDSRLAAPAGSDRIRLQQTRRWGASSVSFFEVGSSE